MTLIGTYRDKARLVGRAVGPESLAHDMLSDNTLGFAPSIHGLWAAGHSYLDNAAPPGVEDVNLGLMQQLIRQLGVAEANCVIETDSGAQLSLSSDTAGWVDVLQTMASGATRTEAPYIPDVPAGLVIYGNNDLILWTSDSAPVVTAWPHAVRAAVANMGISRWYQHNGSGVTLSGGSNVAATTANRGTGYRSWAADGNYAELAIPSDWPGGVIQLWMIGRPSTNGGVTNVTLDGTQIDSFTTVGQGLAATPVPMVRRYSVPAGATALRATQSGAPTNGNFFNGFALEANPFPAVVVANTPRWLQYNAPWGDVTDDKVRKINTLTESVLREFPDSVVMYDLDDVIQRHPEWLDTDGAHLNALGTAGVAAEIKGSLLRAISATGYPATWKAP